MPSNMTFLAFILLVLLSQAIPASCSYNENDCFNSPCIRPATKAIEEDVLSLCLRLGDLRYLMIFGGIVSFIVAAFCALYFLCCKRGSPPHRFANTRQSQRNLLASEVSLV